MVRETLLKIFNKQPPTFMFKIIPACIRTKITRNVNDPLFKGKHEFLSSFNCIRVKKLDYTISKSGNFLGFKRKLSRFFVISGNSIFSCHSFQDNFSSNFNEDLEYSCHCLLHGLIHFNETLTLLSVNNGDDKETGKREPCAHY